MGRDVSREESALGVARARLIDGGEFAELMIDYDMGVAVEDTYVAKKVDSDSFGSPAL